MRYQIYGVCLESDVEIPGARPATAAQRVDTVFQLLPPAPDMKRHVTDGSRVLAAAMGDSGCPVEVYQLADHYVLRVAGELDFWVSCDGSQIAGYANAGLPVDILRTVLLGWVFALVLPLRGMTELHGATAVVDGKCLGFLGHSGAGKSTLAAALGLAGHTVLGDEVVACQEVGGRVLVRPGCHEVRLGEDAVGRLEQVFGRQEVAVRPSGMKTAVSFKLPSPELCLNNLSLSGLYILSQASVPAPVQIAIKPVHPRLAPRELAGYTSVITGAAPEFLRRQFALVCSLAIQTPVRLLEFPRELEQLPKVVEAIKQYEAEQPLGDFPVSRRFGAVNAVR